MGYALENLSCLTWNVLRVSYVIIYDMNIFINEGHLQLTSHFCMIVLGSNNHIS